VTQRYEKLSKIRYLVHSEHLLLREDVRPVASALFENPALIVHIGFDQAALATSDWYQNCSHPYVQAIAKILDQLSTLPDISRLEFMVGTGDDPMTGLQVKLDRKTFPLVELKPSELCGNLAPQTIYSLSK
jgi:3,4-dihydroxy 2-butanone 4-phosphate synthase/GTP cyclohydrolase II